MRGISFWFFATATIYVTLGMAFGIFMAASQDHSLAPAHAHLNLVGWVTTAMFGVYYHLVPEAGKQTLAKVHYAVATVGVLIMVPGIVMALRQQSEGLAKAGAVITLLSMLIFVYTVFRNRAPSA
jgi:cbb3-type cytochrome oxidase subunit 1